MADNLLLTDCRAATMTGGGLGIIEDAAIAISSGGLVWAGPRS